MKKNKSAPGFFDNIWSFFSSVRLTVVVLLLLALTSVIGTLIPQNQSLVFYSDKFGDTILRLFLLLDIFDMYHSWWFQLLILILCINITVCSMDRFGPIWKIVRKKPLFKADRFRKSPIHENFSGNGKPESVRERFCSFFEKKYGNCVIEDSENGFCIFAEKGRWTRLGVYIVHASVLILLLGGLAGSLAGFEGTVKITEGESENTINLKKNGGQVKLDFEIRCDRFQVSHYDNGSPKEYRAELTIIENGKEILSRPVVVNDPLRYKGINIFQSFYGSVPGEKVLLSFTGTESGMLYRQEVATGKEVGLPENFGSFVLMGFLPSYNFRGVSLGETLVGLITRPDGSTRNIILPLSHKNFDKMFRAPVSISIEEFDKKLYTGLQVTKDPGVWLVYAGFLFMITGCFISFYMSHRSICIEVTEEEENRYTANLYATANKNRLGMKKLLERTAEALRPSD